MLVARATGVSLGLDDDGEGTSDTEMSPDAAMVQCYASLRPGVDAAAAAVIELGR
jgi:hypothetical protein